MTNIHLLVLIHGMWGNPRHVAELARVARETHAKESEDGTLLHVLLVETIQEDSTYDGVDWGGERVAKEVLKAVKELESEGDNVIRFSATGYSLGGLIARYCVGILYQQKFFDKVKPVNFNTIATPNCGLPSYPTFFSSVKSLFGPRLLSRTGEQFYCVDKWSPTGRPLLVVMADPDRVFYQALAQFEHIRIYANGINDITVPYVTAAIEVADPFADYEISGLEVDEKDGFPHLVKGYTRPKTPPPPPPKPAALTVDWFKGLKPTRPLIPLPPFLQFRFPFNIVLYGFLPVLIPAFIALALTRLSLASRKSRARIRTLEKEASESENKTLLSIFEEIEREVEEAVVDFIDNPDPTPIYQSKSVKKLHPIITPTHKRIAAWLNTLPLEKEISFFPGVLNSHAMIICRDIKRFEVHKRGEGVVRHWATSLVI
ncbi:hypothetical protein D9619_006440 [Psilocybe cf. subviscida]|uniref:DUF676 domain-containing protein n=1 Tax=Psilocybe cf. subviscida TaxID=2480587 RepID=A0A8H5B4B4_9AGAR|nr:hypothetical protein D9619_006440 [Psilocybe cf. subviscida]